MLPVDESYILEKLETYPGKIYTATNGVNLMINVGRSLWYWTNDIAKLVSNEEFEDACKEFLQRP